jgi:Protein of unknown function (DUF4058)
MTRSPFPGTDPHLEQSWRDVHHSLCTYARDDIQAQLGGDLIARIDERLIVEISPEQARALYPDVRVVEHPRASRGSAGAGAATAVAEPLTVEVEPEDHFEGFIEIVEARGGRVITVIEFISLSNKVTGAGREQYQKKQWQLREGGVSLVEVNLLRAGPPITQVPMDYLPAHARTAYQAVVHRSWAGRKYDVYPMPLRAPLPKIKIPLRQSEPDAIIDLQSLIDRVYRNGAYHLEIDYTRPPLPPLEGDDAQWAEQLLKQAAKK